jgi:carboxypeptidase family protein
MSLFRTPFHWIQSAAAGIAAAGLLLPSGVTFAADAVWTPARGNNTPAQAAPSVLDVSLANGGILTGQVVDGQGRPLAATAVTLRGAGGQTATAATDRDGRFEFQRLGGGLYEVTAAERCGNFRLWAPGSSPPGAVHQVMLVAGEPVTRGQWSGGPGPTSMPGYRNGGRYFGGTGAFWGGLIILGSLGGIVAGGIITGEQGSSS